MKLPFEFRSVMSRLGETLVENLGLKVLSFAFALGLYAFIHSAQEAQRNLPVDVVAMPPPKSARRADRPAVALASLGGRHHPRGPDPGGDHRATGARLRREGSAEGGAGDG